MAATCYHASRAISRLGLKVTPFSLDALGTVMDGMCITSIAANLEDNWVDAGTFMHKRVGDL